MANSLFDKVLLVGSEGMLAHALKRAMKRREIEPVCVDRDQCDITDSTAVRECIEKHKPTLVINAAAYTNVDGAEQDESLATKINGDGAAHLAEACKLAGATLVHYSTDFVFDGQATSPYPTDAATGPEGAYGRSKLAGEEAIKATSGDWLILRTAWLYGPGPGRPFPKVMLDAAKAGKPLKVIDDQRGCPTFTFDLADITLRMLDAGARGLHHAVGGGKPTTWFGFTKTIMETFGVTPESLEPIKAADWKQIKPDSAPRPAYSVLDLSKTEAAIGPVRDWREALRDYRDVTGGNP